jgi:hypothetical protein
MLFNLPLAALVGSASAAILWDGRFNDMSSSSALNNWSWSNQIAPYQWYIVSITSTSLPLWTLILTYRTSTDLAQSQTTSTSPQITRTPQIQEAIRAQRSPWIILHTGMVRTCGEQNSFRRHLQPSPLAKSTITSASRDRQRMLQVHTESTRLLSLNRISRN